MTMDIFVLLSDSEQFLRLCSISVRRVMQDNSLCEKIDEFNVRLNIPKTLKDFGIQEEEFKEKVAKIAELAVGDACTGSNPRAIDPANMEKLLTCTYYGTEVDF